MKTVKIGSTAWGLPGNGWYGPYMAHRAGLDGIQLELGSYEVGYPLAQRGVQEAYLEDAERYGIEYPAVVLNDLMVHGYAKGCNTEEGKIAFDMIELGLEVAHELDISEVMLPNFGENRIREQEHFDNMIQALSFACERALPFGITVLTENPLAWDKQLELLHTVGADNLKIHYDSQNMKYNWDLDQCEQLQRLYPYMTAQLHVKDGDAKPAPAGSAPLGTGNTDFRRQMQILRELGYTGWIITENYYCKPAMQGVTSARESQWDSLVKDVALLRETFG